MADFERNSSFTPAIGGSDSFSLYDKLIEGVPKDIYVRDYCLGLAWSYVEAESGMGASYTLRGGAKRRVKDDLRGRSLRDVAALVKSWNWEEATLGIAALNAYYSQRDRVAALGARFDDDDDAKIDSCSSVEDAVCEDTSEQSGRIQTSETSYRSKNKMNAFALYRDKIEATENAHVVVVGHFPHVDCISEYAHLTVLERNCTNDLDTPDPACEYLIPCADFLFMTGVTLTNKTAPRLLALGHNSSCVLLGPSVIMSPVLFDYGVEMLAGSVVNDPEMTRFAVKNAAGRLFGQSHCMCCLTR